MHRLLLLPQHSFPLSTVLRHGGTFRRTPLSSASVGENAIKTRWYSSCLISEKSRAQLNWKRGPFKGKCYESTAAESAAASSGSSSAQRLEYQPEVRHVMDLIVNSSYSYKDVFVRELISNASDALDKLQLLSISEPELLKDNVDFMILIKTDKDNGIITITDTGIGMTKKELVYCLGTMAQSRTAKFLKALKDSKDAGGDDNLISQFGVGFFSAFLDSDRVVVSTKSPKSDKRYVWEGEANASSYTIYEEPNPEELIPRGTRLTLYLKRDDKGFAHPEWIEKLVRNYSQYVPFPVYIWKEEVYTLEKKGTLNYWDTINEPLPIWLRNPKEVTNDEYNEFYKKIFKECLEPLASSHFTTEGEVEFRSVLYVPAFAPSEKDDKINPMTNDIIRCVKKVMICNDFDEKLLPRYLSFVKGVVESNYLLHDEPPEILEGSRILHITRKCLVRKALDMIRGISMRDNREDYKKFWENFGKHLKSGCIEDPENHKRIAPLLRFFSSRSEEEVISLDEYVENMKPDQKYIYYIAADSVSNAKNTLEKLAEKDLEVLFLVDPIDEVAIQNLESYKEKNFFGIGKEDLDLGDKNEEREKEG